MCVMLRRFTISFASSRFRDAHDANGGPYAVLVFIAHRAEATERSIITKGQGCARGRKHDHGPWIGMLADPTRKIAQNQVLKLRSAKDIALAWPVPTQNVD